MHDLDPTFERFTYRPSWPGRRRHRPRRCAGTAEHVHLQAAAHRRRGRLPPGRHVPVHRPDDASPGSGSPSRTPRSRTGACGPRPAAIAASLRKLFKRAGDSDDDGTVFEELDPTPLPVAVRRAGAARGAGRHDGRAARPAPPLERRQPLADAAATRTRCTASRPRPTIPSGTGCDARRTCRCGRWPEVAGWPHEHPRRCPKVLLHDHLDGGLRPATVVELAERVRLHEAADDRRRRARRVVQPRRQAQRPRALPRDVRPHRRRHAAPRRHRAGRLRVRRRTSPPTASCTPRCAWRPSCAPSRA